MRYVMMLGAFALVAGCGSQQYNEAQVVQEKQEFNLKNESALLGSWRGDSTQIEFHGSHFNQVFPNSLIQQSQLKTGRYIDDGTLHQFHWSIDSSGVITLNMIDGACDLIPLDYCGVSAKKQITLAGPNIDSATWEIRTDSDLDGVYEGTVLETVVRNVFDDNKLHAGKQFLKVSDNFDYPLIMERHNEKVNLVLPNGTQKKNRYVNLSGSLQASAHTLVFESLEDTVLSEARRFKVSGAADVVLEVESRISDVVLRNGLGNSLMIDFTVNRELDIPDTITESKLDLSQFKEKEQRTIVINESVSLLTDININLNETYYSKVPAGFSYSAQGHGNQIVFHEGNQGLVAFIDPSNESTEKSESFTWEYKNEQEIELKFDNGATWQLGFTGRVLGGYSAVFYNENYDTYGHDFVSQGYVDPNSLVPGRFSLESTDGLGPVEVEFKEGGEILITAGSMNLSGFWEIAEDDSVVSFECDQVNGVLITELTECKNQMQSIGSEQSNLKFGHIRKFKFMHSDGNQVVSTYNATAWGAPLTMGEVPMNFNWVYRWYRLGDE